MAGRTPAPAQCHAGTRDLHAPVAYVQTPITAKPKSTCKATMHVYGADTGNMELPELIRQVAQSLNDHGTKVLVLDDITRLRTHRADDQDVLDLIRAFMSMHVTLILIGLDTPGSGLLQEGRLLRAVVHRRPDTQPSQPCRRPGPTATARPRKHKTNPLHPMGLSHPAHAASLLRWAERCLRSVTHRLSPRRGRSPRSTPRQSLDDDAEAGTHSGVLA
ncbi:TniB family NTP-binding protein [Nonomuraea rhodomycinica]|uniref:TniB family NTP-binding protein n=1 Tax=Nonomuraea rhodomycinica TaxID=1712872 RepID=A0A7Y6IJ43_9ACTN|nr:TniB family NTP-binding protein [Nonomuraea rhodomycinica]